MTLQAVAYGGFSSADPTYARIRPAYARPCVARLAELARDTAGVGRVLDLGAGTGILTGQLTRARVDCVAVEPVPAMAAQICLSLPSVPVVLAVAESLPLPDRSIPMVTSGQAFHWFDAPSALEEAARVLMSGGWLTVVWNVRDDSVPWVAALGDLVDSVGVGRPPAGHRRDDWADVVARSGHFEELTTESFPNPVTTTIEGVLDRVLSTSSVAAMDRAARCVLLERVAELLATNPALSGTFDYPHHTVLHRARLH